MFTALTDENVRLAWKLADMAAELARVTIRSREGSLECSGTSFPPEGTSVDPHEETVSTVHEQSSREEHRERGSTCGIM